MRRVPEEALRLFASVQPVVSLIRNSAWVLGLVSSRTNHMLWKMFHNRLTRELITLIITFPLHPSFPVSPSISLISLLLRHLFCLMCYVLTTPTFFFSLYRGLSQHICCFLGGTRVHYSNSLIMTGEALRQMSNSLVSPSSQREPPPRVQICNITTGIKKIDY